MTAQASRPVLSDGVLRAILLAPNDESHSVVARRLGMRPDRIAKLRNGREKCAIIMRDRLRKEGLLA